MLEKIRAQSKSTLIMILFGFIVFVFVFSFGAGSAGFRRGGCGKASVAAVVNGEDVSESLFHYYYDEQIRRIVDQRQGGRNLSTEEKLMLREQIMSQLVDQTILLQAAREQGLAVIDQERNDFIRNLPMFKSDKGQFDFAMYTRIIQRYYQTTPLHFEEITRDRMLAQRMQQVIMNTARISDDELRQSYMQQESKVDLEFVTVPPVLYQGKATPTDAEIADFEKSGESRIKEFYNQNSSRFHKPKQVQVAHILFEVRKQYDDEQKNEKREQANLTGDDLKKGGKFADQVKEYSEDEATKAAGGELPLSTMEALSAHWGAPFAEAAFKLKTDELSAVVTSDKGFHVIKGIKVVEPEDRTLDQVKKEIAKELLSDERARQMAKAEAEKLLAGLKGGKSLASLLPTDKPKAKGKKTEKGPEAAALDEEPTADNPNVLQVKKTGLFAKTTNYVPHLGMDPELTRAAFALTKEHPLAEKVFEVKAGESPAYVVFTLADRKDPDMAAFDKEKGSLRERLLDTRQSQQLSSWLQQQREKAEIETNKALLTSLKAPGVRGNAPLPDDDY